MPSENEEHAEAEVDSEFEDLELPDEDGRDSIHGLIVPYRTVHHTPHSFKTPNRKCFIPGRPIDIKITDVHRTVSTHLLNPNLYIIEIHHGEFTWAVKRRYKHFQHLHQQLQIYRASLSIPFPTKSHRERRSSYKSSLQRDESGKSQGLPRFPKRPEALISQDQMEERKSALEKYIQDLLKIRAFRNHHETVIHLPLTHRMPNDIGQMFQLEFLEVSHLSFVHGLGPKGKEGLIQKRTGTNSSRRCCACACFSFQRICGDCCGHWQRRWLVAKDTFVTYVRPKDGRIHCVMLIDSEFEVSSGLHGTGVAHGVIISNLSRQLVVKCWTKRKSKEWVDYLRTLTQTEAAKAFLGPNRFSSYAPCRRSVGAQWFVDGSDYMAGIADVLESAHEEIFISDWWLSPEIYMKRPIVEGERWRLDKILQRKAKDGVKIFVLLYKEVNLALGINSFYSKQKLIESQSENIKVLRHPDHVSAGVLLWAHHEKLVIVDQMYAFVGGIDLCYGRWDDNHHRLTDLGSVSGNTNPGIGGLHNKKVTSSKPAGGINPSSILHLAKATNAVTIGTVIYSSNLALPKSDEEMSPENAKDIKMERMVSYTSESETVRESDDSSLPNGKDRSFESGDNFSEEDENQNVQETKTPLKGETPPTGRRKNIIRKMTKVSRGLKVDGREWIGKHLRRKGSSESNDHEEDVDETDKGRFSEDESKKSFTEPSDLDEKLKSTEEMVDRKEKKPRKKRSVKYQRAISMREVTLNGLQGSSKLWIGKDYTNFIVKDFVDLESPFTDLVDRSTTPRMPWHDIGVLVQGNAARDVARHFIQRWNAVKDEKARANVAYPYLLPKSYDFRNENVPPVLLSGAKQSQVTAQVLRSVSKWSCGINIIEDSIQQAYVSAIENAKHYVYIENQFFITLNMADAPSTMRMNSPVQNRIGEALFQRIIRAHRENKTFRVFIVIPLLPGFEGEVGTSRGIAIHTITSWNYSSICRDKHSLIPKLAEQGIDDPSKFITFHGLRTHSELHGDLVTELIYVHSKLMIVDDNLVICGSANINDRSLIGKRDSEVAVILEDEQFIDSVMNGVKYKAGKLGHTLRMNLFREHLGLFNDTQIDIRDPISEDFYKNVWLQRALLNTDIYDKVFHCIPSDRCTSFNHLRDFQNMHSLSQTDSVAARSLLKNIKGHLVMLPLKFLQDEVDLQPKTGTKEALMPTSLWT